MRTAVMRVILNALPCLFMSYVRVRVRAIAPFLGVISAVFVFASWLITNGLEARARTASATAREALRSQQEFSLHSEILRRFDNLDKQLTRLETRDRVPEKLALSPEERLAASSYQYQWIDVWSGDIARLQQLAGNIHDLAENVPRASELSSKSNEAFGAIQKCSQAFYSATTANRRRFSALTSGTDVISLSHPPPSASEIADFFESAFRVAERQVDACKTHESVLLEIADELHSTLERRARYYASAATVALYLSYIVFAVGSILAIYGKLLEVREAQRKQAEQARLSSAAS